MRVAIFGLTKTGTTAVFYTIKAAMPADTDCFFEPRAREVRRLRWHTALARLGLRRPRSQLVKFIPFHDGQGEVVKHFGDFDRRILIVRDPRDRFISGLLYQLYESPNADDDAAMTRILALLEAKQADPRAVPLTVLIAAIRGTTQRPFDRATWLADYAQAAVAEPIAFAHANPDIFVLRYEDVVDARFAELDAYLGLTLTGAEVHPLVRRVVRTRAYDTWRDWFTEDDIAVLQPVMQPYLDLYYPGSDWALRPDPTIPPEHGTAYVTRIVDERRHLAGRPLLPKMITAQ